MSDLPQNGTGGEAANSVPKYKKKPKLRKYKHSKAGVAYQLLDPNSEETWLRLRNETPTAYQAFQTYRDMPPEERTLDKVSKTLGKSATLMSIWSGRWAWLERCHAWDRYQERITLERVARDNAKSIADMKKRHVQAALVMQQKVAQGLQNLDTKKMKPHELSRMERDAVMIERISRDVPTEISEEQVTGEIEMNVKGKILHGHIDLTRLSEQKLELLENLLEEASVSDADADGSKG